MLAVNILHKLIAATPELVLSFESDPEEYRHKEPAERTDP